MKFEIERQGVERVNRSREGGGEITVYFMPLPEVHCRYGPPGLYREEADTLFFDMEEKKRRRMLEERRSRDER